MIWCNMIGYDMIWYNMIWYDIIWYDMLWSDTIWYDTTTYITLHMFFLIHYKMYMVPMIDNEDTKNLTNTTRKICPAIR